MRNKIYFLISLGLVLGLAWLSIRLGKINPVLEFPFWAVLGGLFIGSLLRLPERLKTAAKTEPYIKTGLILLGASINFGVILSVGSRGIIQALIGVPLVFLFTYFVARRFRLDEKFAAVLSTAVSICGVSAAIAAGSAIFAKKEHLAYVVTMIIFGALALMFIQPYLAKELDLSPAVAGSWIGNNIDNTAAVVGAGKLHSEGAMKVASIVKMSQNTLIGLATFLLALWFAFKRKEQNIKVGVREIWNRFPKFVLGFILFSVLASIGVFSSAMVKEWLNPIRIWLFAMAFVSIGMTVSFGELRKIGGKPLVVFLTATVFNLIMAFVLANLFFGNYTI